MKLRLLVLTLGLILPGFCAPLGAQTTQPLPDAVTQIQSATLVFDAALIRGDAKMALEFLAPDFEVGHSQYRPRNRAWMTRVLPLLLAQTRFEEFSASVTDVETQEGRTFARGRIGLRAQQRAGTGKDDISGGYGAQWTNTPQGWRLQRDDEVFNVLLNVASTPAAPLALPVEEKSVPSGLVRENPAVVLERPHQDRVAALAFSPDETLLASYDFFRGLHLSSAQSGVFERKVDRPMSINSLCFAPDGTLISGHNDGRVRLWNPATAIKPDLEVSQWSVYALGVSPDGRTLAADGAGTVQLWDLGSGRKIRELGATGGNVHALGFAPDGQTIAFGGSGDVEVWSVAGGRLRAFPNETWLGFTPQGELVTGAFESVRLRSSAGALEREVRIPNPFTPPPVKMNTKGLIFFDGLFYVPSAILSPDGHTLASQYEDGSIGVWDLGSGKLQRLLRGFQSPGYERLMGGEVNCIVFSPDGKRLAAGSRDGETGVWDLTQAAH